MFGVLHKLFKKANYGAAKKPISAAKSPTSPPSSLSSAAFSFLMARPPLLDPCPPSPWWTGGGGASSSSSLSSRTTMPPSSRPRRRASNRAKAAHWRSLSKCTQSSRAHLRAASSSSASSLTGSVFTTGSPDSDLMAARPGSVLGLTKHGGAEEVARRPPSLMTMPALRVRQPSGVSAAGSALTPKSAGEPEEWEEEWEEEEAANLLGTHGPALRRGAGTATVAGYASGGLLPPSRSSAHALAMARSRQTLSWIRSSYSLHASVHLYSFPLEGDPSPAPSTRFSDEVRVCTRRAMDVDIKGLSLPSTSSTSGFSCGSDAGCCTSSWWSCPSACRSSLHYSATFDSTNAFGQILLEEDEHGNTPISFPQPHVRISTECDAKSLKHRSRPPDPECRRWILSQSRLQSRTGTASCALPRLQRSSAHAVDAVVISASFECVWIWSLHCLPIVFIVLG
ncbi:uncharacterized protein [Triticum aestivum]|uniref:uncharacterized protein n=1 Tax=Triticum aestivum TaxID=4565 RepID=UPI001D016EB2|nr:uncharacterized protein LOC123100419 [Triticum aestivum]